MNALNVGYQKSTFIFIMYENDIKMFMSPPLKNSLQRKQAGSWKVHKCPVSVSCFVLKILLCNKIL